MTQKARCSICYRRTLWDLGSNMAKAYPWCVECTKLRSNMQPEMFDGVVALIRRLLDEHSEDEHRRTDEDS